MLERINGKQNGAGVGVDGVFPVPLFQRVQDSGLVQVGQGRQIGNLRTLDDLRLVDRAAISGGAGNKTTKRFALDEYMHTLYIYICMCVRVHSCSPAAFSACRGLYVGLI